MHFHCSRQASASRRTSPNSHSHNHSRSHAARALRPRASRQSPPHHEQGISELAALGKQLVECLPHAGAAAVLTVIMAREHPAGCQESQRPADVVADGLGLWSPSTKISPKLASPAASRGIALQDVSHRIATRSATP